MAKKIVIYCGIAGYDQKIPLLSSKILQESIFMLALMGEGSYQG